eukprot:COSAG02_NODE_765_length_17396_cov_16.796786_12_plen_60_part_00
MISSAHHQTHDESSIDSQNPDSNSSNNEAARGGPIAFTSFLSVFSLPTDSTNRVSAHPL